ncbi:hypothetical protein GUITHDRAFT_149734 [Guillardia theta CCMP2712]|uniref:Uncharacterized protein n=1 Tax=Guillardia theta (strain CCMP2712) TaxID=905079 RepID=L1K431_GUITC|nr:hypothetical protein GUITHDRAFT_149734 [Guillardia theta CCMP2712]EKX55230.1 hypothetical protein GUITHDRAFT_149734 [Guillardia theta CCMP2712]|mmetsp:Transcript_43634/g.138014  ORF Transcript_43634/g.138014 Transcript_43634/m.138014 type:complete len:208 (-) Transcript_43634:1068-1691(-)|eukprot:XP_005842210.1 hypothetical protein GUITHDRAFT_149734 [Guillardia theta CCMP2712]
MRYIAVALAFLAVCHAAIPHESQQKKADEKTPPRHNHRQAATLYMAIIEPKYPKKVTFPLSDEDDLKFHAARDALMEHVRGEADQYDLNDHAVKAKLRGKTLTNQDQVQQHMIKAVQDGMTMQEARIGMIIAQFEDLPKDKQEAALQKAKEHRDRIPAGTREKVMQRMADRNREEREQLNGMATPDAKTEWVQKRYQPSKRLPPTLQ